LEVAYAMQEHLEYVAEPTVWTQGVFKPSSYTLIELVKATRAFQFAIFVFSFDDVLTVRHAERQVVRDNVVFEFGLFVGALGLARCFFITPRASEPLHLPTDLLGLEPLTYAGDRADRNIVAALGPAANRVRRAMREIDQRPESGEGDLGHAARAARVARGKDYVDEWNSDALAQSRMVARSIPSNPYGYDDEELPAHRALRRLFTFLESLADSVLSGQVAEEDMRDVFGSAVTALWPHMYVLLAPPNQAEDWWRPSPKLAELYMRWTQTSGALA
jgi:hypothetical protein